MVTKMNFTRKQQYHIIINTINIIIKLNTKFIIINDQ